MSGSPLAILNKIDERFVRHIELSGDLPVQQMSVAYVPSLDKYMVTVSLKNSAAGANEVKRVLSSSSRPLPKDRGDNSYASPQVSESSSSVEYPHSQETTLLYLRVDKPENVLGRILLAKGISREDAKAVKDACDDLRKQLCRDMPVRDRVGAAKDYRAQRVLDDWYNGKGY